MENSQTDLLRTFRGTVKGVMLRTLRRTDYSRWNNAENLMSYWESRTEMIAQWIDSGSRVLEFGAGQGHLKKHLPANCIYMPSDLRDRGDDTIICDLNARPLPDFSHLRADVAVFSGVLEYVHNLPAIIIWLGKIGVKSCVASYEDVADDCTGLRRVRENLRRSRFGYMNCHSQNELLFIFERSGFACEKIKPWTTQHIYRFVKRA
jgi:hypothetical protein